jgi:hypothetical protein
MPWQQTMGSKMTPYEQGQQAFKDFGQEAENPFECEDDLSYVKWLQFEKGWTYENDKSSGFCE